MLANRSNLQAVVVALLGFFIAAPALAVQFPLPSADTRLHTLGNGPGATWNTGGLGVNGQVAYDQNTGILNFTAEVDKLNYFDPNDGGCATDSLGSNCTHTYATPLDLSVSASLDSIGINSTFTPFHKITLNFETTGSGPDITLIDPTDNTLLMSGNYQAGTFNGNATTGLSISVFYNSSTGNIIGDPLGVGFFEPAVGGSYAQLFDNGSGRLGLDLGEFFDFNPSVAAMANALFANGTLINFTAEGEGQVFRIDAGQFVPEPTTPMLLGSAGLLLLGVARRWRSRK